MRARCGADDEVEIRLDTVWEINRRSILDFGNQRNHDRGVALAELVRLKESGGSAVVDLSNFGLDPIPKVCGSSRRNPAFTSSRARATTSTNTCPRT